MMAAPVDAAMVTVVTDVIMENTQPLIDAVMAIVKGQVPSSEVNAVAASLLCHVTGHVFALDQIEKGVPKDTISRGAEAFIGLVQLGNSPINAACGPMSVPLALMCGGMMCQARHG